jgi:Cu-Zn family superoxide dismutase
MMRRYLPLIVLATLGSAPVAAQDMATATVRDRGGKELGEVTLQGTASGVIHLTATLAGLPPGTHGVHLHETGDCSAEDFSSANDHISAESAHGIMDARGFHPGDLPNITVPESGQVVIELFLDAVDLDAMIFDEDGAAFVVHESADDYSTQPSGDSGDRIACGEFGSSV